jgi:hypothetical protein
MTTPFRAGALAALAGSAIALTSHPAAAQTDVSWANTVSGNWGTAANWNPATVPNNSGPSTFNAHINVAGSSYIVTANGAFTVTNFEMLSPDAMLDLGTNTLTVVGNYTQAAATLRGMNPLAGAVLVTGTTTFTDSNLLSVHDFRTSGPLIFNGVTGCDICDTDIHHNGSSCSWLGNGDITMGTGSSFTNGAASTFGIQNDRSLLWDNSGARPTFTNLGTINKSTGAGQTFFDGVTFSNTGTLQVSSGSLKTNGVTLGGDTHTLTGGTWKVQTGGSLLFVDATNAPQTITTNSATVTLDGATSAFAAIDSLVTNAAAGRLTVQNGHTFTPTTFNNQGQLTVGSATTFHAATLQNVSAGTLTAGTFAVQGTLQADNITTSINTLAANLTLDGAGAHVFNVGGTASLFADAVATGTIAPAGMFDIKNGANFVTGGNFANNGLLKTETNTTFAVAPGRQLLNIVAGTLTGGAYNVQGTLQAGPGQTVTTLAANVTLDGTTSIFGAIDTLQTVAPTGAMTIKGGRNFTTVGAGPFTVSPGSTTGSLTVESGSDFIVNAGSDMANFTGGVLHDGTLNIRGFLHARNASVTRIGNALVVDGIGDHIINSVTGLSALATVNQINSGGSYTLLNGATQVFQTSLTMQASSAFTVNHALGLRAPEAIVTTDLIQEGGDLSVTSAAVSVGNNWMHHAGTATLTAGSLTVTADAAQDAGASLTLAAGSFSVGPGHAFTVGGLLAGNGSVGGRTINNGTIAPGNPSSGALPVGLLSFAGDLVMGSAGILDMQIGGLDPLIPEFDQIHVSDALTLDGTFRVAILPTYTPVIGDTFDVLTWGSLTNPGGDFAAYEGLDIGGGLRLHHDQVGNILRLTVVPAPGALALLPALLAGATRRRRRAVP